MFMCPNSGGHETEKQVTDLPEYWSMAQAVAWACTRDNTAVMDVTDPQSLDALTALILRSKFGQTVPRPRLRVDGTARFSEIKNIVIPEGEFCRGTEALAYLEEAILTGRTSVLARDVRTGERGEIPKNEKLDLIF